MMARWVRLADATVGGRPLAATRMLYAVAALIMLRSSWRRLDLGFDPDAFHLSWPVVGDRLLGVPPTLVVALWAGGAVLVLVGVVPRIGAASVVAAMGMFYAVDRQHYANGGYLLVLIGILLVMADAGASRSPWGPDRRRTAWWPTFLLASQLSITYLWAAVQKFRPASLRGDTISWQLQGPLAEAITWSGLPEVLNLLGGGVEIFCAIALWFPSTRKLAVAAGIGLHLGVLGFVRDAPDLLAFGVASVALYPAFWSASAPLAGEIRDWRASGRRLAGSAPAPP
jgi:hypothetical protein